MKEIEGSGSVPVIYSAHHASHKFGEFEPRVALSYDQRVRFSDYGTAETVPVNGLRTIIAERSRALADLNRDPDDAGRFQNKDYAQPDRHDIWLPGHGLTPEEKIFCQENFYDPYHGRIIELLAQRSEETFVVAWDNTANYKIGTNESGTDVIMPSFILSNRGQENTFEAINGEASSCDSAFMELLAAAFKAELSKAELPQQVELNLVYKGGYICRRYSTSRNQAELSKFGVEGKVQSLQLEYNTDITHIQGTLEPIDNRAEALREAFSNAIAHAISEYKMQ